MSPPAGTRSDGKITRLEVLRRAEIWVKKHVPYNQSAWWDDPETGTYRQDCSGYVAMAWHLAENINYWTGNLPTVSSPIEFVDLLPGDILLSQETTPAHTLIFAGWSDPARTTFKMYEQSQPGTAAHFSTDVPIDRYVVEKYQPYRYNGIAEAGDPLLAPGVLTKANVVPPLLDLSVQDLYGQHNWRIAQGEEPAESSGDRVTPAAFEVPGPSPLVAAGCAAMLACAFPMIAVTSPLRRALLRPLTRSHRAA